MVNNEQQHSLFYANPILYGILFFFIFAFFFVLLRAFVSLRQLPLLAAYSLQLKTCELVNNKTSELLYGNFPAPASHH